jgi:hypothetical protein
VLSGRLSVEACLAVNRPLTVKGQIPVANNLILKRTFIFGGEFILSEVLRRFN